MNKSVSKSSHTRKPINKTENPILGYENDKTTSLTRSTPVTREKVDILEKISNFFMLILNTYVLTKNVKLFYCTAH